MLVKTPSFGRLLLVVGLVVPALAWFVVKPVRLVAPQLAGVSCTAARVCVDDDTRLAQALELRGQANAFIGRRFGAPLHEPLVVFCSTQACAQAFGLGARSAVTMGTVGTVIGPNAWMPYYVRHELIHQLQGQRFGVIRMLFKPAWLIEGMAYGLSEDPRPVLAPPWQGYRAKFLRWHARVGDAGMWTAGADR